MPSIALQYHVNPDAVVTVRAQIGDAQGGGHGVFIDQDLVAQAERDTGTVPLGRGADLVGRRLTVSSVAVDIQPMHDHVSVLTMLTGGVPDPLSIPQVADAPTNGAVNFVTVIFFV